MSDKDNNLIQDESRRARNLWIEFQEVEGFRHGTIDDWPIRFAKFCYAAGAADALESLLGDMQHDKCGCLCYDSCPKCKIIAAIRARQEQI